jgi:Asp-tRNA(Asn)/Glu-tRNA(Gln) amidotransferase B subunit
MSAGWEVVIGLEIHTQLSTKSKIFSAASTAYGAEPNTQACLVDLGYPGVLPVLNEEVVHMAAMFGLAVNATVAPRSVFARKNYFYPDLPKGYQISQYELPIVEHGELFITDADGNDKRIGITRAHLEEDAGKSIHEGLDKSSGIDLNRAGTPLLEIVSEPDNCLGTRHSFGERSRCLHAQDSHDRALPRDFRRQHAGRFVPLRCQHFCAPERSGRVRHARGNQKPEFVPLRRKSDQLRG